MRRRAFRFGVIGSAEPSRAAWRAQAQAAERLGYSTLVLGDHLSLGAPAPFPALLAAADATTTLRVGTHVLSNDIRHPAVLAHEAATIDLLTDGRLDLGLGAGWLPSDYEAAGLVFEPPGIRLSRLIEAVTLIKRLLREETVSHSGAHYTVNELSLQPRPIQRPHPPVFIGGGGRRLLSFAAREADIVSLDLRSTPSGGVDAGTSTAEAVAQQVAWVRQAAGPRLDAIELHTLVHHVVITDDWRQGVDLVAARLAAFSSLASNTDLSSAQILESPHVLIGTVEQIADQLSERRERYGFSYITVSGEYLHSFGPVVERLAGG
jgi:probable F420-dependent oxidoreductase